MASFSDMVPARAGAVRAFFSTGLLDEAVRALALRFLFVFPGSFTAVLWTVSAFAFSFVLAGGFFFFSGFGGGSGILPAAMSRCSCSYAAAASSPSFCACRVASSPYKMRCAQA